MIAFERKLALTGVKFWCSKIVTFFCSVHTECTGRNWLFMYAQTYKTTAKNPSLKKSYD